MRHIVFLTVERINKNILLATDFLEPKAIFPPKDLGDKILDLLFFWILQQD
tara:strand:+ start:335655 stop:335807 length:153 start_codon:yes stop_codon:yes gene_type:complete